MGRSLQRQSSVSAGIFRRHSDSGVFDIGVGPCGQENISAEVRNTSTALDYSLVVLTIAPFFTGFLAYHQIGPYKLNLILHIIFAEMLLIVIPFSKLSHIALFFRRK